MVQTPTQQINLYPDSDGKPMAENTEQYRWIALLVTNLKLLLKDRVAFVAGDLLWYPVQSKEHPAPCQAPDAMVVLGRPEQYRGSYKQWEEGNIAPQVVFEIISPSNTAEEMLEKQSFYSEYGILEAYFYSPAKQKFWGLVRNQADEAPRLITPLNMPWRSPSLGIEFRLFEDGLAVFYPDGEEFQDPEVLGQERTQLKNLINEANDLNALKQAIKDAGINLS
ncbi:MAG: Uma2 family endonuclease [Cyanobacteria bacterium P01_H01_bin.121]